mmetsp:Transcript_94941/g.138661  ORF Transcript_94941/g.138661 Transcript_94941/m.138661 type:complete len:276 (+) Transcript_94941:44-871(+)
MFIHIYIHVHKSYLLYTHIYTYIMVCHLQIVVYALLCTSRYSSLRVRARYLRITPSDKTIVSRGINDNAFARLCTIVSIVVNRKVTLPAGAHGMNGRHSHRPCCTCSFHCRRYLSGRWRGGKRMRCRCTRWCKRRRLAPRYQGPYGFVRGIVGTFLGHQVTVIPPSCGSCVCLPHYTITKRPRHVSCCYLAIGVLIQIVRRAHTKLASPRLHQSHVTCPFISSFISSLSILTSSTTVASSSALILRRGLWDGRPTHSSHTQRAVSENRFVEALSQ